MKAFKFEPDLMAPPGKITIARARELAAERLEEIAAAVLESVLSTVGLTEEERAEAERRINGATERARVALHRQFDRLGADA